MSKKCFNCGAVLEDDAMFCTECGEKQEPVEKKCGNCGAILPEGAKFCMKCGTPVTSPAGDATPATSATKQGSDDFEVTQPDDNTLSFNILGVPFNMKYIRGGMLGNTELSDFYLGETVVTQALWQTVMGSNPSDDNSDLRYPVTGIDLQTVKTFLTRLKKITGSVFDIPTYSQLKYAALKGCEGMESSAFDEMRWGDSKYHQAGGMMPNLFGLYDLSDWWQIVSGHGPFGIPFYRFNPKFEESKKTVSARQDSLDGMKFKEDQKESTFRIVINIPVDSEIEKEKKLKESRALKEYKTSFPEAQEARILICLNRKCGFIDKTGEVVIPCKYDNARDYIDGLAPVRIDEKWGYIDKTGKVVVQFKYDEVVDFSEGLAAVKIDEKWGYIDKTGKEVIPFKYDVAYHFSEGLAIVEVKGKLGYIDKTGKVVVQFKYDKVFLFSEGLAIVEVKGKRGYIDKTGKEVIPCKFDNAGYFSEGLAVVEVKGKWGYIDKTGKEVIPCKYDDAFHFSEGLAAVKVDKKWGYIDKTGKEVIPCNYDKAREFKNGVAEVSFGGKKYRIYDTGSFIHFWQR